MEKRAQVTLFIIVGILIVSVVLVFFFVVGPRLQFIGGGQLSFESCVQDFLEEDILRLEKTAGFSDPGFSYSYYGDSIPYICYTEDYYKTCTVQKPILTKNFERELKELSREKIDLCYTNSLNDLRSQGYEVQQGKVNYNISLDLGKVRVDINAPSRIGASIYEEFRVEFNSPVYEMLMLSTSIIQYETTYGDTNLDQFMILHPDYIFQKLKQGDGTTIYIIQHKTFEDRVVFASRSLVFPPGFG